LIFVGVLRFGSLISSFSLSLSKASVMPALSEMLSTSSLLSSLAVVIASSIS